MCVDASVFVNAYACSLGRCVFFEGCINRLLREGGKHARMCVFRGAGKLIEVCSHQHCMHVHTHVPTDAGVQHP